MHRRSRELLAVLRARWAHIADERGSVIESIGDAVLAALTVMLVGGATIACMTAIGSSSGDAERLQALNALSGKPTSVPGWALATTPITEEITLPSGLVDTAYLWAVPDMNGTDFLAAIPSSKSANPAVCADPDTVHPRSCLYVSAYHAADARHLRPQPVAGLSTAEPGTIVTAGNPLATAAAPTAAGLWRYYVSAHADMPGGTIHVLQGRTILATIPVTSASAGYFGTFTSRPGDPITFVSADRDVTVGDVLVYEAGGTP